MLIEKLEIKKGSYMENVDTVEQRDELIELGIDVDAVEKAETLKQTKELFTKKIREKIDKQAQSLGFDNLYNAGVYQTEEDNPLKPYANALGAWAGLVWGTIIEIEKKVEVGELDQPTTWEELDALLPKFG